MLQRVCGNLIGNAIKYSPSGSEIKVKIFPEDTHISLQVADQGFGIPAEDRENIFKKFFRSKQTDKIAGTGLGLSITREIVEQHGGKFRVEEREGGGSVFVVEFRSLKEQG